MLDHDNKQVYAYTRELNEKKLLVLLNFSAKDATVNTDIDISKATALINNYSSVNNNNRLRPYEAVVYELSEW